jgi:phosphoribosylformylglycinamidine synthase
VIEFDLTGEDAAGARSRVDAMCQRLLANPVIEGYRVDIAA